MPEISELAGIQRSLGRIEGSLDEIKIRMAVHSLRTDEHDKRLGKVERRLAWYAGAVAVITVIFNFIAQKMGFHT